MPFKGKYYKGESTGGTGGTGLTQAQLDKINSITGINNSINTINTEMGVIDTNINTINAEMDGIDATIDTISAEMDVIDTNIDNISAVNRHNIYKIAGILDNPIADTAQLLRLYPGVTASTAFAVDSLNGVYELLPNGTVSKLTDYFNGLTINDNFDNKFKKWDGSNWQSIQQSALIKNNNLNEYTEQDVPLLFIFGGANADGKGNTADLPGLDTAFPNSEVRIWDKSITKDPLNAQVNRVDNGVWKDYALGDMVTTAESTEATAFGPELGIAMRWRDEFFEKTGKQLHIIKCAVSGSSLITGNPDTCWSDEDDSLRDLSVNYFAIPAIRQLQLNGLNPKCIGVIWGQGEKDSDSTSNSKNYLAKLKLFFLDIKKKIGFPDARELIMGLSNIRKTPNWGLVKQAQIDYSNQTDHATIIRTDGSGDYASIATYSSGLGAGAIYYSSPGLMALADLYFDNLDLYGTKFVETWDYVFIGATEPVGSAFNLSELTVNDKYGELTSVQYPTSTGFINAVTFSKNGYIPARASNGSSPAPMFKINALDDHQNIEVIFRMVHSGNAGTQAAIMLRSAEASETSKNWDNYQMQITDGGAKLFVYKNVNNGWKALPGSPVIPTPKPAAGELYWYRMTFIGNKLTIYNSPDGKIWTEQYTEVDSAIERGNMMFMLWEGKCDRRIQEISVAHIAFDVIMARKLP